MVFGGKFCSRLVLMLFVDYMSIVKNAMNGELHASTECKDPPDRYTAVLNAPPAICQASAAKKPEFVLLKRSMLEVHRRTVKKAADGEKIYVFDIDETLYPHNEEILKYRERRILELGMHFGLTKEEYEAKKPSYQKKYKSVIKGLVNEYLERDDAHGLFLLKNPISGAADSLEPDEDLHDMLLRLKGRKMCFTNATREHAMCVLTKMGILECFDVVFFCDYREKGYLSKPDPEAYQIVLEVLSPKNRSDLHFFDDKLVNIEVASNLGWQCTLVTKDRPLKCMIKDMLGATS